MTLDLTNPTNRMAAQAEIDRLYAMSRTRFAPSFSDAELDPEMYAARDIIVAQHDETQLSGDVQKSDLLDYETIRSATLELSRLRGESLHETQAKLLELSHQERDPLSMTAAIAQLAGATSRRTELYGVRPETLALANRYVSGQSPLDLMFAGDMESAMALSIPEDDVLERNVRAQQAKLAHDTASYDRDHDYDADEIDRIALANVAVTGDGGSALIDLDNDARYAGTGDADAIAARLQDKLPFLVHEVGSSGDGSDDTNPSAEIDRLAAVFNAQYRAKLQPVLPPVPAGEWNARAATLATGLPSGNPSPGAQGRLGAGNQGALPRNVSRSANGSTTHVPNATAACSRASRGFDNLAEALACSRAQM